MTHLTRNETLLLTAALQRGPAALRAWETWRCACPLGDGIDSGFHRMIPLLHHNLCAQGVRDPVMADYAAIRRFYWFRNRLLLHEAERILILLGQARIRTLALKGLSLALDAYPGIDLRPMGDIDLLVPEDSAMRALRLLQDAGLRIMGPSVAAHFARSDELLRTHHAISLKTPDRRLSVDLHVRLNRYIPSLDLAEQMMSEGAPLEVGAARAASPRPTEHIFHLIMHGHRTGNLSTLRWAGDVAVLIHAREADIDWGRLAELGERYLCLTVVREAVVEVFGVMGRPLPDHVRNALNGRRVSLRDRLEWRYRRRERRATRRLPILFLDYLRFRHGERERDVAPNGFIAFLMEYWMLQRKRDIPKEVLRRLVRRFRRPARGARRESAVNVHSRSDSVR